MIPRETKWTASFLLAAQKNVVDYRCHSSNNKDAESAPYLHRHRERKEAEGGQAQWGG